MALFIYTRLEWHNDAIGTAIVLVKFAIRNQKEKDIISVNIVASS